MIGEVACYYENSTHAVSTSFGTSELLCLSLKLKEVHHCQYCSSQGGAWILRPRTMWNLFVRTGPSLLLPQAHAATGTTAFSLDFCPFDSSVLMLTSVFLILYIICVFSQKGCLYSYPLAALLAIVWTRIHWTENEGIMISLDPR